MEYLPNKNIQTRHQEDKERRNKIGKFTVKNGKSFAYKYTNLKSSREYSQNS